MLQITENSNAPPMGRFYKGKYLVTDDGRIFTMAFKGRLRINQQKTRIKENGYYRACINGHDEYVHRIVASCFVPNPCGYKEINHKDGQKWNNCADNLEWCTRSQNNRHAFQTGLRSYAELSRIARMPKRTRRILSPDDVAKVRKMMLAGFSDRAIAEQLKCSCGTVYQIRIGKTYKEE